MEIRNWLCISLFIFFAYTNLAAQIDSTTYTPISAFITLDSFVVKATRKGFDLEDFINIVQTDQSFFKAFHNLRFVKTNFNNHLEFFTKKGKTKASYFSKAQQFTDGNCRTMELLQVVALDSSIKCLHIPHRHCSINWWHLLCCMGQRPGLIPSVLPSRIG